MSQAGGTRELANKQLALRYGGWRIGSSPPCQRESPPARPRDAGSRGRVWSCTADPPPAPCAACGSSWSAAPTAPTLRFPLSGWVVPAAAHAVKRQERGAGMNRVHACMWCYARRMESSLSSTSHHTIEHALARTLWPRYGLHSTVILGSSSPLLANDLRLLVPAIAAARGTGPEDASLQMRLACNCSSRRNAIFVPSRAIQVSGGVGGAPRC